MPKIRFNKLVDSITGKIDNMILYEADGQNLVRSAPKITADRSDKQEANSDRFKAAGAYATAATADPALKAAYEALCVGHQNARNIAIRDALTPPIIQGLNLESYTGKSGEFIRVQATDDSKVKEVQVVIRDTQGILIEEGPAAWNQDQGDWSYQTRVEVPSGQTVSVTAVARDNPGNIAQSQRWQYLG